MGINTKYIVIGDCILDHNIYTTIQNPKLKDYVTEYNFLKEEYKLGGCGNVVANLIDFADSIFFFSAIGDDEYGKKIETMMTMTPIQPRLYTVPNYNTTVKHRYYHNGVVVFQHANYIKKECLKTIRFTEEIEKILQTQHIDCMILCESEKSSNGILSIEHCQALLSLAKKYNVPTIVDPKEDIEKYKGCTLLKPNIDEAYELLHVNNPVSYQMLHTQCMNSTQCTYSMITLSENGISVWDGTNEIHDKYEGTLQVVDAIGAGDIVTTIFALFLHRMPFGKIVHIATYLASKSVEQTGVVTIRPNDIQTIMFPKKEIHYEDLTFLRSLSKYRRIGVTTGCFDLFHSGHFASLNFCKKNCDILIVCINSDTSVKALKGNTRPIEPQSKRIQAIVSLECVDYCIVFEDTTAVEIVKALQPDVFMKGGDYKGKYCLEADYSKETLFSPYIEGISTTIQLNKIPCIEKANAV